MWSCPRHEVIAFEGNGYPHGAAVSAGRPSSDGSRSSVLGVRSAAFTMSRHSRSARPPARTADLLLSFTEEIRRQGRQVQTGLISAAV